ncbi:MAG: GNAT family N-acetyltransferase [Hyphomicrobiales bacterium]|nr:GNAT family N-acetyltransferase [Hyphomicrobiales bacterium]
MPAIRPATCADLPRVHEVRHGTAENRLTGPSKVTDKEVLWYMDHAIFLVSQADAGIVQGFTCANHQTGYIWALFVIDGQHRKGRGSGLLGAALQRLKDAGHRQSHLTTGPGTVAEQFYRHRGWIDMGRSLSGEAAFVRHL